MSQVSADFRKIHKSNYTFFFFLQTQNELIMALKIHTAKDLYLT